jgi:superfamily I DNA/RNA helicase
MHLAKGLEFGTVVVMACDDEVIPLQERIEAIGDEADLREVYETERHLLYVACTRAHDGEALSASLAIHRVRYHGRPGRAEATAGRPRGSGRGAAARRS